MNDLLQKLLDGLKGTSGGTRVIVALVAALLVGIAGLAAVVTNRPHYELAFSGLTDHELAQVCRALAEAAIPFEQSQPPGPFVIYVDEAERTRAYMAVYGAGALDKPLEGILSDAGMASVFNSAEERAQGVRKREWQEMEKMLAGLDFVSSARVRTSSMGSSPFADPHAQPISASVTLHVAGGASLTPGQAATVANLVSRGLGIHKADLMISDQSGRSLYDGEEQSESGREVKDLLAHQAEHDQRSSREANAVLEQILGPGKARVSVSSEWDYAQTTTSKETSEKGAVVQETKTSSEKPQSSSGSASSTAGLATNTLSNAAPGDSTAAAVPIEKTSEEKKSYAPSVSREQRVRFVPELKRLSLALFLDQSVDASVQERLEGAVKAAVGFDEARNDAFSSVVLPFVVAPVSALPVAEGAAAAEPSQPNPLLESLLKRGVEIVSAVVFLGLLLKTLGGSKKKGAEQQTAAAAAQNDTVDPELLARAQIDELLKSDPAKVGEILSRWAREEPVASKA
ncbi:MAG: hypothetical protein EXS08_11390 [Planctomycetes bacterium]|nr:hypothetical protein [Planctomycetota bacterium]